jgi:hypothetical protein
LRALAAYVLQALKRFDVSDASVGDFLACIVALTEWWRNPYVLDHVAGGRWAPVVKIGKKCWIARLASKHLSCLDGG